MILGVDCWAGSLDIDEPVLLSNGVKFIIPRLNSISGYLHKDDQFDRQWNEAVAFLRAPYFVYSPWYTGAENADWLLDNLPSDGVTKVMVDIEVRKDGYSPSVYAAQVGGFINQIKQEKSVCIYTGGWFLGYLSSWPAGDYWWARYPTYLYPPVKTFITWDGFMQRLESVGWNPDPTSKCPGDVKVWQCSADRYYLPGTAGREIDVNAVNMDYAEFCAWWGAEVPLTLTQRVAILEREAALRGWNLEP